MAKKDPTINPRTARTPADSEPKYVIAYGAPKHYVSGYGICGAGDIVSLAPGVSPGKHMVEVAQADVDKVNEDPTGTEAIRLSVLARSKITAGKNDKDADRKEAKDEAALAAAAKQAEAEAKKEADALAAQKKADDEAAAKAAEDAKKNGK